VQRFCREGVAWRHLRHPNILPLLGVTLNEHRFALVSEWMENGNINEFIEKNQHVNRVELVSRGRLLDPPAGASLMYHSAGRGCEWLEVHARHPHGARRSERSAFRFFQMKCIHTYTKIYEGKHTGQQGPASLHRRLRSVDHHWGHNSRYCRSLSGVVDFK